MMLCPLNVVLKLNRFVNVTCSFNIRGEYFKVHLNHPTTQQLMRFVRFETAGLACKLIVNCTHYVVA